MVPLLDDKSLHASGVVANCTMNRERQLRGSNGYSVELAFDVFDWLSGLGSDTPVRWLDVCCGSGRALVEAVELFQSTSDSPSVTIHGIDLAGHFLTHKLAPTLQLIKTPLENWDPEDSYDLVTCVHGLHYIGDKLSAIKKMANCLSDRGLFAANLDLANLRFADGTLAGRTIVNQLRDIGMTYEVRTRLLKCTGKHAIDSYESNYLGADDGAGPNYTGQPAVNSYYEV